MEMRDFRGTYTSHMEGPFISSSIIYMTMPLNKHIKLETFPKYK